MFPYLRCLEPFLIKYNAIISYYEVIIGYYGVINIMGYSGLSWVIMGFCRTVLYVF